MTNAQPVRMDDVMGAVTNYFAGQLTEDDVRLLEHMARCARGYDVIEGVCPLCGCEAHHHGDLVNGEFPCPE